MLITKGYGLRQLIITGGFGGTSIEVDLTAYGFFPRAAIVGLKKEQCNLQFEANLHNLKFVCIKDNIEFNHEEITENFIHLKLTDQFEKEVIKNFNKNNPIIKFNRVRKCH